MKQTKIDQMNNKTLSVLGGSLMLFSQSSSAATVVANLDFRVLQNVTGGVNEGGLMLSSGSGAQFANNGDDLLKFRITIDDTADSGAVFTSIVTVLGLDGAGGTRIVYLTPGIVNFLAGSSNVRQNTLTVSMGVPTQVSGPAATINFDGFASTKMSSWTQGDSDSFTIDGATYTASVGDLGEITFGSLAPSGSTFEAVSTGNFRQDEIRSQFTITAIPEPSSVLLVGFGALGLLRRRRG
ncbi:MAG: PEP-CTERM sorting domain-containing protein [Verrucomicrobiaceae bacterium]